jgi:hypothetical protein
MTVLQDHDAARHTPPAYVPFPTLMAARTRPVRNALGVTMTWSARFMVDFVAQTPLLIRDNGGEAAIPASVVRTAMRSLHATMTGSCRRVSDHNIAPIYRDGEADTADLRPTMFTELAEQGPHGLPADAYGCDRPLQLCPSCLLFGTYDQHGVAQVQPPYPGHVQVLAPTLTSGRLAEVTELPQTGVPEQREHVPPGSPRNRLFGWRRPVPAAPAPTAPSTTVRMYPAGTSISVIIHVMDIEDAQLGALIATIEPHKAMETEPLAVYVGGGRPMGYGRCVAEINLAASSIWPAGDSTRPFDSDPIGSAMDIFRKATPNAVQATWPTLAKVLSPDEHTISEISEAS